jgi:uncharacterized protein YjiS (DUF1127 family)
MLDIYADARRPSILVQDMIQRAINGYRYLPAKLPMIGELPRVAVEGVRRLVRRLSIESELQNLSDHMLADIGVIRGDIARISREWAKHESPMVAAKVKSQKTEIPALVDAAEVPSSAVANDDASVRAA